MDAIIAVAPANLKVYPFHFMFSWENYDEWSHLWVCMTTWASRALSKRQFEDERPICTVLWSRDIYYICWCLEKLDVSDIRSPPNWAQSDTLIYRSPSSEKKKNLHCMAEPKWGSIWFHLLFQTCETLKRLSCSLSTLSMAYIYILPYFLGGT